MTLKKGLTESILQENDVWKISSGNIVIIIRKLESEDEEKWEVVGVERLNCKDLARIISKLLKGSYFECDIVLLGLVKFKKNVLNEDRILQKILKNKAKIEQNTGWKL